MIRAVIASLLVFIVYIVYTGSITVYDIVTGIGAALVVGMLIGEKLVVNWRKVIDVRRWGLFIRYVIRYFFIDEVIAHWTVIKLGLSPSMPIKPAIVRVPIESKTEYAQTAVALSITNTPGTVVVDADRERGVFYVHWIYAADLTPTGAYRGIAEVFDKYAKKIFD